MSPLPKGLRSCLFLVALLLWSHGAHAVSLGNASLRTVVLDNTLSSRALGGELIILRDAGGVLSSEQAWSQDEGYGAAAIDEPNFGITPDTFWARVRIHNASSRTVWYLEQSDAMTRFVDVWTRTGDGTVQHHSGGSMRPVSARNADALTHAFTLDLPQGSTTDVLIRLRSDYVATFKLNLRSTESFLLQQRHLNLLHGLYLGIMLSLVVYNLFLFRALREAVYLDYALLMTAFTVFNTSLNGQLPYYVLPAWPTVCNALMIVSLSIVPALFALFGQRFLDDDSRWARFALRVTTTAGVVSLLIALFSLSLWTWVNTLSSLFVLTIYTVLLMHRIVRGDKAALYFMVGVGWFIGGGGALILGLLALMPFEALSTEIGSGIQAIFLSLALAQRMRHLKDASDAAHHTLQQQHAQLESTHRQLVQQEKLANLGLLSAGVAHEINNPNNFLNLSAQNVEQRLHELQGFIDELMGEEADAELTAAFRSRFEALHGQLALVRDGSARIAGIVKGMRAASRNDTGEGQHFDPAEGLLSTVELVKASWKQVATFDTSGLRDRARVAGSASQLNQVFTNLLVNACHAIEEKQRQADDRTPGVIALASRREEDFLVIDIADSGCGMPEHVRQRLFEPFFTTKGADRGTGLGMGICRGIIDDHKGRMEVASTAGVGTRFSLFLPIDAAA